MTVRIPKTAAAAVAADFADAVEQYRQKLLEHRFSAPARQAVLAQPAIPPVAPIPPTPARGLRPAKPGNPGHPGRAAVEAVPAQPGVPRPTSHPLIEACIVRVPVPGGPDNFIADYQIYDDTIEQATPVA